MRREPLGLYASGAWFALTAFRVVSRFVARGAIMLQRVPRLRLFAAALLSVIAALSFAGPANAKPPAPGAPGAIHVWAPADKHGFGTAEQLASKAWFTLRQGSLSEIYYPDLSTPGFRGLQFAVSDGRGFLQRETVDDDPRHIEPLAQGVTSRVEPVAGSLAYRQVTQGTGWRLTKTWITDPARATVLARVRFESLTGKPLRLYVLADPAPGNDGNDDRGVGSDGQLVGYDDVAASGVAATPAMGATTSGYRGSESDPWIDLQDGHMSNYDATEPGNVVQGARTALNGKTGSQTMTLAIGFGANPASARATATQSLAAGFAAAETAYNAGWLAYRASLSDAPESVGSDARLRLLYDQSLLVLAASEDKTYRGASIAAPNMAWIWGTMTLEPERRFSGPYHLVWPRDLYHVATAQKAAGDDEAAGRLLDYLWEVQKADGSWWQNTFVDGTEKWTTEQLDQTSLPIVLAWWLGRMGPSDWDNVERAADYLVANGPRSDQERWENQDGYSPNTIATEIAGLICAADIARKNGATGKADDYEALADSWQQSVEGWTATTNGPYSPKPYYVRVTKDGNPDDGSTYNLGDNFNRPVDEREIVDNSFLGLVLFGVKKWNDQTILNSLDVGDGNETTPYPLKVDTPSGPVWHRFTYDGYGEQADGRDWDLFFDNPARQTRGRLWPLLTGERGEYELISGRSANPFLRTIANTANDGLMLPEQVWDDQPPPGERSGKGTRSATPLAWTHGQFVRLAWSIDAGLPIERPSIVACRYQQELCP
ncbi:MAG TPA: glycoside hydrolase family 15 protein [Thermoleophilaceae bacterium]